MIDLKIETLEDPLLQFRWIAEPNIFELNLSLEVFSINLARLLGFILNAFNPLYLRVISFVTNDDLVAFSV